MSTCTTFIYSHIIVLRYIITDLLKSFHGPQIKNPCSKWFGLLRNLSPFHSNNTFRVDLQSILALPPVTRCCIRHPTHMFIHIILNYLVQKAYSGPRTTYLYKNIGTSTLFKSEDFFLGLVFKFRRKLCHTCLQLSLYI